MSNFMKIRPVGADMLREDEVRTNRHTWRS